MSQKFFFWWFSAIPENLIDNSSTGFNKEQKKMNQICYIFIFRTRLKNSWTFGIYLAEHPKTDSGYGCSFVCVIFYILLYIFFKRKIYSKLAFINSPPSPPSLQSIVPNFIYAGYLYHSRLEFSLEMTNKSFFSLQFMDKQSLLSSLMFDFSFCLRRKILLHLFSLHFFLSRINTSTSILHPNNQFFTKLVLVWDILNYHKVFSLFHRFPFPIL